MYRLILVDVETVYSRSERRPVLNERYVGELALTKEITGSVKRIARKYNEAVTDVFREALLCYFGDGEDNFICRDCERFPYLRCCWNQDGTNAEHDWYTLKEFADPVKRSGTSQDGMTAPPLLD